MLKAYGVAAAVFLVLDGLWLLLIARSFYQKHLGHLFREPFLAVPAVLFYLIFVAALVVLAILPALESGRGWPRAAMLGAVLGLAAYATYDLTNYATLKGWSPLVTAIDLAWGTFVSAATAAIATAIFTAWK